MKNGLEIDEKDVRLRNIELAAISPHHSSPPTQRAIACASSRSMLSSLPARAQS